ncbi:thiol-disulfide oxidoreductase [Thalassoglobus neptunius]|uniref:Thiol-disulfide oxidoreductase n=1 Tax=Thalassoglobus neptunius TaxID=1938619 RepID=A0A5C5WA81_9PLAN|nr:redoxin domain-containing protein [Thalassoglobus neptunius]TWT47055.1 thiol-disulfide oxidoreductase [Thalassoglobus neptunius]
MEIGIRYVAWLVCLATLLASGIPSFGDDANLSRVDLHHLKGVDLEGHPHRFGDTENHRATVVVFLSTSCPISCATIPTLQRISTKYRLQGVEVFGVISNPGTSREEAIDHVEEFGIRFPVLFDSSKVLRNALQPTHTPQALVISNAGVVAYSGRIDNRFTALGRRRGRPSIHDLEDATKAVVLGRSVRYAYVEPIGCLLENKPQQDGETELSFHRDIAPILHANCVECHRAGEAAPFTLQSYEETCRHAEQIVHVTKTKFMPPWHPSEGYGEFRNTRGLAPEEIQLIEEWVRSGMPEGDTADALPHQVVDLEWRLGKPDLILTMEDEFELGAEGPDIHQHFVLPIQLHDSRLVSAVEFRPGNRRVVHHACFYIDTTHSGRKLSDLYPDVGYGSFVGPGFLNAGALRSWLPGMSPQRLPKGTGQPLHAHSDLVLEIHYQRTGKVERDRSQVGLYFTRGGRQVVGEIQVMNKALVIPAGESDYRHESSFVLPVDATLLDTAPHMHLLGKEMKATATLPNGTTQELVWIRDWDFNWQGQYLYKKPVRLPKGTRIDVVAIYDNSESNPLNPNSPPKQVTWGEQTKDEMGVCHFRYLCDSHSDLEKMNRHYLRYADHEQARYRSMLSGAGRSE